MTLKQTKLIVKGDGSSALYIDGVMHGTYSKEYASTVKELLKTLAARDADLSVLNIEEE